jgi:hypothetical protein
VQVRVHLESMRLQEQLTQVVAVAAETITLQTQVQLEVLALLFLNTQIHEQLLLVQVLLDQHQHLLGVTK